MFIFLFFTLTGVICIGFEVFFIIRDAKIFGLTNNKNAVILTFLIIEAAVFARLYSDCELARLPGDQDLHIVAGIIITLSGMFLRYWAVCTLGPFFRTVIVVLKDQPIIKTGPYKWIRHPSYTGAILIFSGLAITLGNLIGLIIVNVLVSTGYYLRILIEEQVLLSSFGQEYMDYIKETKKLVPFIY